MKDQTAWGAFGPADLLVPQGCDLCKWSVVACDQYTSQPDYWDEVERTVGDAPSTLRLMFPEAYLEQPGKEARIASIHAAMRDYLAAGRFEELADSFVYIERALQNGGVRRGLVGAVDLEQYDYGKGSASPVRPTEGTVASRIPPRMRVRRGAPIELSHVLLLVDDEGDAVFSAVRAALTSSAPLYDFELMQGGGHLRGWRLPAAQAEGVRRAFVPLYDPAVSARKYGLPAGAPVLAVAVGDGNHSLATAKACYEELKAQLGDAALSHPARWAMAELVNIHDPSLVFEPIHRVVTGVDAVKLCRDFFAAMPAGGKTPARLVTFVRAGAGGEVTLGGDALPVGVVQAFLDDWMKENGGKVDYIHGDDVARRLGAQPDSTAILLPALGKSALFAAVAKDGALPRKTFSMGEANEKRFYLECRRIGTDA